MVGRGLHRVTKDKIEWAKVKNEPKKSVCKECGYEGGFKKDRAGGYYCPQCGTFR